MAEILGVVAGAVGIAGFALQIVESVQKLRGFASKFKHARSRLEDLLEELDVVASLIACSGYAEGSDTFSSSVATAQTPLNCCQKAARIVSMVVKDVERVLDRRKGNNPWTSLTIILREKEVEDNLQRLERAKTLLLLAQQCLTQQQLRKMQESQSKSLEAIKGVLTSSDTQLTNRDRQTNKVLQITKRRKLRQNSYWLLLGTLFMTTSTSRGQGATFKFHPAAWTWWSWGLELTEIYAFGRPSFLFRTFRTISRDDPIWIACAQGDQEEVERLFSRQLATPYDVTADGTTLLHISAAFHRVATCKLLLEYGVSASSLNCFEYTDRKGRFVQRTPLMMATSFAASAELKECFQDKVNYMNQYEMNALFTTEELATFTPQPRDTLETIQMLMEHGSPNPFSCITRHDSAVANFGLPFEDSLAIMFNSVEDVDLRDLIWSAKSLCVYALAPMSMTDLFWRYAVHLLEEILKFPLNKFSTELESDQRTTPRSTEFEYLLQIMVIFVKYVTINAAELFERFDHVLRSLISIDAGICLIADRIDSYEPGPDWQLSKFWPPSLLWALLAELMPTEHGSIDEFECFMNELAEYWLDILRENDRNVEEYLEFEEEVYLKLPRWTRTNIDWYYDEEGEPIPEADSEFFYEICLTFIHEDVDRKASIEVRLQSPTLETIHLESGISEAGLFAANNLKVPGGWV